MTIDLDALAARVEALTAPNREVDALIAPVQGLRCVDEGHPLGRACYDRNGHAVPLPRYTASLDAAMTLGRNLPWLVPVIHYADRTVRLVNGAGFPVGGTDHLSEAAGDMCCAVAASWLKARARQRAGQP